MLPSSFTLDYGKLQPVEYENEELDKELNLNTKDTAKDTATTKDTATEDTAIEDIVTKDIATKDTATKDTAAKDITLSATNIHHAVLLSCVGWRLNRLPEVKAWIAEAQQYPNIKVDFVGGDPRFVFYDDADQQIGEELNISDYTQDQIHTLLKEKGLTRVQ